jgi:hypothetical protein
VTKYFAAFSRLLKKQECMSIQLKSHQRSWWFVHTQPTQRTLNRVPNPTNAVGGLFIPGLQTGPPRPRPNPTNKVGGLFIPSLTLSVGFTLRLKSQVEYERSTNCVGGIQNGIGPALLCRLSMNDPPTVLVGFRTEPGRRCFVG